MSHLTEAEKIARYDAERSGAAYVRQPVEQPRSPLFNDLKTWIDQHVDADQVELEIAQECDTAIAEVERGAIAAIYPDIPIVRSRDQAHRQERWLNILEQIAQMDPDEVAELLGLVEGLIDSMETEAQQ